MDLLMDGDDTVDTQTFMGFYTHTDDGLITG